MYSSCIVPPTTDDKKLLYAANNHNSPIFNVTVMIFNDIVESVMLLNEEACKEMKHGLVSTHNYISSCILADTIIK